MTQELAKAQKCVVIRGGFEIWVDTEKADRLQATLQNLTSHLFITWGKDQFNTADVTGIFSPETMDERTRRKNGQWQCQSNGWHDRFEKCTCGSLEERTFNEELTRAVNKCDDYDSHASYGWVKTEKGMAHCPKCSAPFFLPNGKPNYAHVGVKRAGA
jgi:hypothetical protein